MILLFGGMEGRLGLPLERTSQGESSARAITEFREHSRCLVELTVVYSSRATWSRRKPEAFWG
mgnify:CR=1